MATERPIDPDVAVAPSPLAGSRRSRWPRLRPDVVAVVFAGGCAGGAARYAATSTAPSAVGAFPWATLAVNLGGAFVLSVVIVLATDVVASRYLRPLLGTGFCGALTTFSAVVVAADRMLATGHSGTAAAYLAATLAGGLAAAALGLTGARAFVAHRRNRPQERSTP